MVTSCLKYLGAELHGVSVLVKISNLSSRLKASHEESLEKASVFILKRTKLRS